MIKPNAEEVVKAFRKAAKELGCNQSEQRFQDVLFAIGRDKPLRRASFRIASVVNLVKIGEVR